MFKVFGYEITLDMSCYNKIIKTNILMLKQKNDRIALYIINIKQRKLEANKRALDLNK